jgi:NAD+ synthase (glutamine-hydrolysing)
MDYGSLGFFRVAAVQAPVRLADPAANGRALLEQARLAVRRSASLVLFPELCLTGYTCEDLFQSEALLSKSRDALARLAAAGHDLPAPLVVGAPFRAPDDRVYNAAFVLYGGRVRGAVPKIHLPNYGEFYERRWFASGRSVELDVDDPALGSFRLAARQVFESGRIRFGIEVCEDLWAPEPPSGGLALAGASVLLNLSASNELVAKADYRRELVRQQSARLNAAYVYVSSGPAESTKDVVYGGHALIAENGTILAEGARFAREGTVTTADVDVERLLHERARNMTFAESPAPRVPLVRLGPPAPLPDLGRTWSRTPFVPDDPATVNERAREILSIQAHGLARRLESAGLARPVLGLSGGLDSTLALLVAVEACRLLAKPAAHVLAVGMPGPGTTEGTRRSATELAGRLGVEWREIPIGPAVAQHFKDLGHDPAKHDVVFENAQARERTQVLFDVANQAGGLVVGTGDLSELALGWCTYNADQMANYAVNVAVPKTLVKHLIRWWAGQTADVAVRELLGRILDTVISPELLPPRADGAIGQATEDLIGPYELHDFFLWHHVRHGSGPRKVLVLAEAAFRGAYPPETIRKWLRVFLERYYRQQFKRTTLPPGPKVGSVSLSPRGDLRMPDEVDPASLLAELD